MDGNKDERELHDRASRGLALPEDERERLNAWYREQDEYEARLLNRAAAPPDLATLQARLDTAFAQLEAAGRRVRALTRRNNAIRREIADLQQSLIPTLPGRSP